MCLSVEKGVYIKSGRLSVERVLKNFKDELLRVHFKVYNTHYLIINTRILMEVTCNGINLRVSNYFVTKFKILHEI